MKLTSSLNKCEHSIFRFALATFFEKEWMWFEGFIVKCAHGLKGKNDVWRVSLFTVCEETFCLTEWFIGAVDYIDVQRIYFCYAYNLFAEKFGLNQMSVDVYGLLWFSITFEDVPGRVWVERDIQFLLVEFSDGWGSHASSHASIIISY